MSCATTSRSRRPASLAGPHPHAVDLPQRCRRPVRATTSPRWNGLPEVSAQTRRTVSRLTCPPSSPTSHCCTSATVNGGTSMRSTTSSFHSSSHGDCRHGRRPGRRHQLHLALLHHPPERLALARVEQVRVLDAEHQRAAAGASAQRGCHGVDGPRDAAQRDERVVTQQRLQRAQRDARRAGGAGDRHDVRHGPVGEPIQGAPARP